MIAVALKRSTVLAAVAGRGSTKTTTSIGAVDQENGLNTREVMDGIRVAAFVGAAIGAVGYLASRAWVPHPAVASVVAGALGAVSIAGAAMIGASIGAKVRHTS